MEEFANRPNRRVASVGTYRHGLMPHSLQDWLGFFLGASLLIPCLALLSAVHNSS